MPYYAKIKDGNILNYPYKLSDMKADCPDVDFTQGLTEEVLRACSAVPVKIGEAPKVSSSTHILTSNVEIDENNEAVLVTTAKKRSVEEASYNLRKSRDAALSKTDWVITRAFEEGTPVPPEYLEYRQKLRDLTKQEGFPYEYVWPKEPRP